MQSFSERTGIKAIKVEIQRESVDDELRTYLWNGVYIYYLKNIKLYMHENTEYDKALLHKIWLHYFKKNIDEIVGPEYIVAGIKKTFFKVVWNELFDLLEFFPNNYKIAEYDGGFNNKINNGFCSYCNDNLEQYLSAYRFINRKIVEITSNEEIQSIEDGLKNSNLLNPVTTHLKRSLELFSDRLNPDYRNSIKESISAVEAYCKIITQNENITLGKALAIIEKKFSLHGSLKTAFTALYGFSSDAEGIRHALLSESTLRQEDAKFMLVACTSFINYLAVKTL